MPWTPRDLASTIGTYAASVSRRLHVWRIPYPPKTGLLWHLQGASATCAADQRLLLDVDGCPGPPATRSAPLGRVLHRCFRACMCGAPLTLQKAAFSKTVAFALAGRVSHLRHRPEAVAASRRMPWTRRDSASTIGTCAASVLRRLHVWLTPYPLKTGLLLNGCFGTCRARQPSAPQARGCCCMSADVLDPQGLSQRHWDVRCIGATALARVAHPLPSKKKPSLKRRLWHLQGSSATCAADQRLLLHVRGCPGHPGTRPAPLGRALHWCHGACTCGAPLTLQKQAFS